MKTGYREEERAENALSDIKSSKFTKQICLSFEKIVLTKKKQPCLNIDWEATKKKAKLQLIQSMLFFPR